MNFVSNQEAMRRASARSMRSSGNSGWRGEPSLAYSHMALAPDMVTVPPGIVSTRVGGRPSGVRS